MTRQGQEGGLERNNTNKTMWNLSQQEHCQLTSTRSSAFLSLHCPSLLKIFPFPTWNKQYQFCLGHKTESKHCQILLYIHYSLVEMVIFLLLFINLYFLIAFSSIACVCVCVCARVCSPAGPPRQHLGHHTWCWPIHLYMTAQTVTSVPVRMKLCHAVNPFIRTCVSLMCLYVCERQTCPRLSKLYFRRLHRYPASRHCVLLVMLLTSSPSQ